MRTTFCCWMCHINDKQWTLETTHVARWLLFYFCFRIVRSDSFDYFINCLTNKIHMRFGVCVCMLLVTSCTTFDVIRFQFNNNWLPLVHSSFFINTLCMIVGVLEHRNAMNEIRCRNSFSTLQLWNQYTILNVPRTNSKCNCTFRFVSSHEHFNFYWKHPSICELASNQKLNEIFIQTNAQN